MIQISDPILQINNWKNQLATAIRDPQELLRRLELPLNLERADSPTFPLRVPHSYIQRMKKGDVNDPLFRQVFPLADENNITSGFTHDPVGDIPAREGPGIIHKYQGRVLLTLTGACAIHCRYCFRRHYPYQNENPLNHNWHKTMRYLNADSSIHEVILSGGDPLSLSDDKLSSLIGDLATISHIQTLRIHTRLPIVLPDRINQQFISSLAHPRLRFVLVVHANHPNEIDRNVLHAFQKLNCHNVTLLNQSVLLRGINNSVQTLEKLSHKLFSAHVLPYYLHQLDRVAGAAHFEVTKDDALGIMEKLRNVLPGYLVPRLVTEQAGALAKIPLV